MRKGDQVLQQLLADPEHLSDLKRLVKLPNEAPVWFIIVHVSLARLDSQREGRLLRVKLKQGGEGWSVVRETSEASALRPSEEQLTELTQLHWERRQKRKAQPEICRINTSFASTRAMAPMPSLADDEASFVSDFEADLEGLPCIADFNSSLLFVCSNLSNFFRGTRPDFRLRLAQCRRHTAVWRTVCWAQVQLDVQAGVAGLQETEAKLYTSKAASKRGTEKALCGVVDLAFETRAMRMGDLRSYGLTVGSVVAAPLPGQEAKAFIQGVPVQAARATAAGEKQNCSLSEALARRRHLRKRMAAEDSDSSLQSSSSDAGTSSTSPSPGGSSRSQDSSPSSSNPESEDPPQASMPHSVRKLLRCSCR